MPFLTWTFIRIQPGAYSSDAAGDVGPGVVEEAGGDRVDHVAGAVDHRLERGDERRDAARRPRRAGRAGDQAETDGQDHDA